MLSNRALQSFRCQRRLGTARAQSLTSFASGVGKETSLHRHDASFRMAVIGSGPAGFYTAYRVMGQIPQAKVDMYESLPVPFGLVRYGVAPDHPEVKNCQDKFEEIASSPNFNFVGNVSVGRAQSHPDQCVVDLKSLLRHYDSVVFAYGASEDKKLGIPGESTLSGIYSARQFVGWYNGLPDCAALQPDLTRGDEAVIIGQGNVALDVARMLLEDIDVLRKTDITEQALAVLAKSRVRRVHVVGRRGPMQAAFTIKEVRELMRLKNTAFRPVDRTFFPEDIKSLPRASRRISEVLLKGSTTLEKPSSKLWSLDSCLSPKHFLAAQRHPSDLAGVGFEVTELQSPFDPGSKAIVTEKKKVLPAQIAFRSVGYKSTPLRGFDEAGIQFDDARGIMDNDGLGRVMRLVSDTQGRDVTTQQVPGLYCAGWVKRGPTGVIASTMSDAFVTGDAIVQDWLAGALFLRTGSGGPSYGWDGLKSQLGRSAGNAVTWDQWRVIDRAEKLRGLECQKEREKFTSVASMLGVL